MKINTRRKLLPFNIIIIAIIMISISFFSKRVLQQEEEDNRYNFMTNVESMKKIAKNYLISEQGYVDNWTYYISSNDMTLDEAWNFLKSINTNEKRMAHIVDVDTFEAYTTYYDDIYSIATYKQLASKHTSDLFEETLDKMMKREYGDDTLVVLGKYLLQEKLSDGIALGHKIKLKDKNYLLLRVLPSNEISNFWTLSSDYPDGVMGLMNKDGDYVIKPISTDGDSFIADIIKNNPIEELELRGLKGTFEYKDLKGREYLWYYSAFADNPDLYILGGVSLASLKSNDIIVYGAFATILLLIILIICDAFFVRSINKKLETALYEANKANKAKTEFLSAMSHDIRTPMNIAMGMTSLAYKNSDSNDVKDYLKKSMVAGKQLLTLINDILDISKIESGKLYINSNAIGLKDFGNQLKDLMLPYAKEKDIELSYEYDNLDDTYVIGDETRLNQVCVNLLSNAIKYTPKGKKVFYSLSAIKENELCKLVFVVKDEGIGMSEEFQKTMYNSFTRAIDSRTNSKTSGTGLGLTITKRIVDLLEGDIECVSKLNEGTTFRVTFKLPLTNVITDVKDNDDKSIKGIKVMVVEDNDLNFEIVDALLNEQGCITKRCVNGKECVDEYNGDYDVILMDIQMPIMNGYKACEVLREKGVTTPIIAMSADAFEDDVARCLKCGMNDHVSKPINAEKLFDAIRKVI